MRRITVLLALCCSFLLSAQDYFLKKFHPFDETLPSPEEFLGYGIGDHHTRHDLIVAYFEKLAELSDKVSIVTYGKTYEGRKLVILTVSSPGNLNRLEEIRKDHLAYTNPEFDGAVAEDLPVFINLGYNVHGNEPSSSEAALLTAYTFAASGHPEILNYLEKAVLFIDPAINPDGRDRHTQWANSYQGDPLVTDPQDAEHNENWPGGRTNHYWFDLNRDWLLAIHPESRSKLNWYHQWYPNVVTDFHEMGSRSTYFFEPMKNNGSLNPIMPRENYEDLNELFGDYYASALDSIGSFYFTKEVFDGTYPGYGSSYPDLQGGLGLLFEQASSRGHAQKTSFGEITFPFTIRNQYVSGITTVKAAVENRKMLYEYQREFFRSALENARGARIKGYSFGDPYDQNRVKAFIDKLLLHRIEVYKDGEQRYMVPAGQPQYRMVQTVFETYDRYRDSVYYDASAWSLANFYNMKYSPLTSIRAGDRLSSAEEVVSVKPVSSSDYAYIINWDDYNAPALLYELQKAGLTLSASFKPFSAKLSEGVQEYNYGSLLLPVSLQKIKADSVFRLVRKAQQRWQVPVAALGTAYSEKGIDMGSSYVKPLKKPKAAMLIGHGLRSYEAGEVWHLLDTRVGMPITKIQIHNLSSSDLDSYNTLVMVSGTYSLPETQQEQLKTWVKKGNTLITIGTASKWVIEKGWVKEKLIETEKDSLTEIARMPYTDADELLGKEAVGGLILRVDLDRTHPLGFGYRDSSIPVYKNNSVWLAPSKNPFSTVAQYAQDAHIDGFITEKNREEFLSKSASLLVSPLGEGRVVLFADNPNFRGSWYGTNRLFLNALFLGNHIEIPEAE